MESFILGGLLKRVYPTFDMLSFNNRLKLQKIVFLIQSLDLNIGYYFNFYLYGPYSTDLTRSGFQIENYDSIKKVAFADGDAEKKFQEFIKKIEDKKEDLKWLECATSIIYLYKVCPKKEHIFGIIKNKNTHYSEKEISKIWEDLEKKGWLNVQA